VRPIRGRAPLGTRTLPVAALRKKGARAQWRPQTGFVYQEGSSCPDEALVADELDDDAVADADEA
jgi:hypothetical protein